jgi:FAD synthase
MAIEIIRGWRDLPEAAKGAAVAIGAFDGVHRGHQAVIAAAREAPTGSARPWPSSASTRIPAAGSSPTPPPSA